MKRYTLAILLAACGGDDDAATIDGGPNIDGDTAIDGGPEVDAAQGCATGVAPVAMISATEGVAIAADGTMYFSQSGHLGRWVPGTATPELQWVTLTGTTTVWGVAIDAAGLVYVASPPRAATARNGTIWRIDPANPTPPGELYVSPGTTDRPNGLTIGPDGAAYYSDFQGGHVYRVDSSGNRTVVTTATVSQPNGVLFDDDGTLLVLAYSSGNIHRLTLDANHQETGRVLAGDIAGNPDGLARDEQGRYYVTDNGNGAVLRFDASFTNPPESLLPGVGAAANMAFGRGALGCHDLYVTSSGAMRRLDVGAVGVP